MSKVVVEDQSGRIQYSEGWEKNAVCVACDTTVDKVLQAASAGLSRRSTVSLPALTVGSLWRHRYMDANMVGRRTIAGLRHLGLRGYRRRRVLPLFLEVAGPEVRLYLLCVTLTR